MKRTLKIDDYFIREIAIRMMCYVHDFRKSFQNTLTAKYKKGVFADINKNFTHCDNTGVLPSDYHNSFLSKGYTRYEFKGFDWTVETLMLEIEKLYKINLIKNRVEDLKKDFQ